jgi:hypothetical protein
VTNVEINKVLQEWSGKRKGLDCPMWGKPCDEGLCRFWLPFVVGKQIGPNLPPLLDLQWMCQFDQIFNGLSVQHQRTAGTGDTPPDLRKRLGLPPWGLN